ncbi:hypothetical protein [Pedobacter sp. SL55]|uniref:hypothetical protein n=1 Tax=Pedobacter sp. SL55 TaxID=2995161 RepID=UPI00226FCE8F|nr:hypothetical protein [Pedobacter sp. SL55]WAC39866.1 hypothetical protein OVA16_14940 [Pedobacter sp. SL55]
MIYIDKRHAQVPAILLTDGATETQNLRDAYDDDNTYFDNKRSYEVFKSSIYGNSEVKNSLIGIQNHKCCFCESRVTHISDGDVEHFRPKAAWLHDTDGLKKPGYFFLAYEWSNLLLSCQACNQRAKGNQFPILNSNIRTTITSTYDCSLENAIFINPSNEDPEISISFFEEIPKGNNYRGRKTIEYLELDRFSLNDARREKLKDLFALKDAIDVLQNEADRERAEDILRRRISEIVSENLQYVSMVKCNFQEYLD